MVNINLIFLDISIPVKNCDDGYARVPLKPISDALGLRWRTLTRKLKPHKYHNKRLGVAITPKIQQQKPVIQIRVDRIKAFLETLNPEMIKAKKNHMTFELLEEIHNEWDDVFSAYSKLINNHETVDGLDALGELFTLNKQNKKEFPLH